MLDAMFLLIMMMIAANDSNDKDDTYRQWLPIHLRQLRD